MRCEEAPARRSRWRLPCCSPSAAARREPRSRRSPTTTVEITSNFTGEQIVVFGAVAARREARHGRYEVAIVVQGPDAGRGRAAQGALARHLGQPRSREFDNVPVLLCRCTSARNFSTALDPARPRAVSARRREPALRAGGEWRRPVRSTISPTRCVDLKRARGLYVERERRGRVPFAERLPHDVLPAERHPDRRISRQRLPVPAAKRFWPAQTQLLSIEKGGFSERIARAAHDYRSLYGLACVALAIFTGWFAGVDLPAGREREAVSGRARSAAGAPWRIRSPPIML